ncbi:hypothetical protein TRAPUB_2356 [Trametes pubescens]|uniref:Uncharacterized protein n=1 Tax=Trametes pubescens TaxID=154538 RepID=A0A1M2VGS4_TRAPU|nr:hypothetical protein TRAPUB_2356 [Trametes pubescens]
MSLIPLLAPLISRMTTHVIDDQWSAEEAFVFFSDILAGLSPDTLDSCVSLSWDRGPIDNPDLYWSRLSPEFQSSWNTHRSPPISLFTRALRWANTTDIGYSIVSFIRRYLQIK